MKILSALRTGSWLGDFHDLHRAQNKTPCATAAIRGWHRATFPRLALTLGLAATVAACAGFPEAEKKRIRVGEEVTGTSREVLNWRFHSILEYQDEDNSGTLPPQSLTHGGEAASSAAPSYCRLVAGHKSAPGHLTRIRGHGLQFPGYIVGIEKTDRDRLGLQPWTWNKESCPTSTEVPGFKRLELQDPGSSSNQAARSYLQRRLDDPRRTFLSHIVQFKLDAEHNVPRIDGRALYDVYADAVLLCDVQKALDSEDPDFIFARHPGIYCHGRNHGLAVLAAALNGDLAESTGHASGRGQPYTHVFVYAMGWNTSEARAVENYNALFGYLLDAAAERTEDPQVSSTFKPLFIGLSWPSTWSFGTSPWDDILRSFSLWSKKDDADEVGVAWANPLINGVISQLKQRYPETRIVLVGHSFGARILTRALYSCPLLRGCTETPVDLLVGLQAAIGRSRYAGSQEEQSVKERFPLSPMHHEGRPYTDYSDLPRAQQVFVWSRFDAATSAAPMLGGADGIQKTLDPRQEQVFDHIPTADEFGSRCDFPNTQPERKLAPKCWVPPSDKVIDLVRNYRSDAKRVLLIDGSGFVRHETPEHGGGAHSDIYTREIGRLTWELVKRFAPSPQWPLRRN